MKLKKNQLKKDLKKLELISQTQDPGHKTKITPWKANQLKKTIKKRIKKQPNSICQTHDLDHQIEITP
jgi:hypothetical protein